MEGKERFNMRRVFLVTVVVCFISALMMGQVIPNASAPAVPANQTSRFKFTQDGAFANVNFSSTASGFAAISLRVATGTGGTDSLQYSSVTEPADFSSITLTNVFGPIPSSAFTGQNTQTLALSIDTSTLPAGTLTSETCTIVFSPFSITCGAGTAGPISLSWRENDAVSTTVNQHTTTTVGPVTTRTNEHSDTSTANVTGSIFGTDVSGAAAQVGVSHMSTIEIFR